MHLLQIPVYLCHFRPKFFPEPLQEATPAQISAEQTHLALNTRFQRSSTSWQKVVGLRKISKKRKNCKNYLLASQSQETSTQLVLQVNACGKYLSRREKWAIERVCSLIWRWLMTFWVWASYRILMSKMRFCKSCLIKNSSEYVQSSP